MAGGFFIIIFMTFLLFLFFPIFSLFIIFSIPSRFKNILFYFGIFSILSQISLFISLINIQNLPYNYSFSWIKFFNINFSFYIDNLSASLVLLNLILYITSFIFSMEEIKEKVKEFLILSFLTQISINGIFLSRDLFLFYIFFAFLPVPLFFIIKEYGYKELEYDAYKFLIYLFLISSFFITGILIYVFYFKNLRGFFSFDIFELSKISLKGNLGKMTFFLFLLPFLMYIPIFPFPKFFFEIIANSKTFCSSIISGVILKIGIYGIIRIVLEIFPDFLKGISNIIIILSILNMICVAFIFWKEKNFKKILSYLSLFYMALIVVGIFTFQDEGFMGSIFQMFNHGITICALFIISGSIYKRGNKLEIEKVQEIINSIPFLKILFIMSILSIIFLPGLNNFPGTFLIFYSIFKKSIFLFIISVSTTFLICLYFLSFLIKLRKYKGEKIENLSFNEIVSIIPLIFLMLYSGIWKQKFLFF